MEHSPESVKRRLTRRQAIAWSVRGLAAGVVLDALIEPNLLQFQRVEVPIQNLPSAFDGYRIALLSDIHYPRGISVEFVQRAVGIANEFAPDVLALTGDFVDHKSPLGRRVAKMDDLFRHVQTKDGIFGVLGNHDHWLNAEGVRRELTQNTPVRLIENAHVLLERDGQAIALGGVGDLWEGVVKPEQAFAGVPPETPRILLSHNPDLAEDMTAPTRIDLQLSGHTHGGEVYIGFAPLVPSNYGNKFRAGLVAGKHHRVYVTRGICAVSRIRLGCRPEVTGLVLRPA